MSDPAVFDATYFTHKPIVTRKCVQLVFEVPEERLLDVLRMLQPKAGEQQVMVAIARLNETPAEGAGQDGEAVPPAAPMAASPSVPKKAWREMKPSQQAALRCKDARFQAWMGAPDDEDETARRVRSYCTVRSRAHIDDSFRATERWRRLDGDFLVQTGQIAEAR